jgi:hypothetical protein
MSTEAESSSPLRRLLRPAGRVARPARQKIARWRFLRDMRRIFAAAPTQTLNDNVFYKTAFDRRRLLTTFADSAAVRDYVTDRVGTEILTRVYQVLDSPGRLRLDQLPDRFVIKPTHASRAVILVDDRAPADARLLSPAHHSEWRCGVARITKGVLNPVAFRAVTQS